MAQAPIRISWKTEEYAHKEKGPDWFWALGVIAIASATLAVVYHDILFALLIIIGALFLGYYAARKPDIIDIAVSDDGIIVREYLYPFATIKGFNIEEHPTGDRLIIESERVMIPVFSIPLPNGMDVDALRALLKEHIEEKPLHEKAAHRIMERLGF